MPHINRLPVKDTPNKGTTDCDNQSENQASFQLPSPVSLKAAANKKKNHPSQKSISQPPHESFQAAAEQRSLSNSSTSIMVQYLPSYATIH